jgi:hypothetical protein
VQRGAEGGRGGFCTDGEKSSSKLNGSNPVKGPEQMETEQLKTRLRKVEMWNRSV